MKMEQTECSQTSAYKLQTLCNYPKESIQHTEQGESLKSRNFFIIKPTKCTKFQNLFWHETLHVLGSSPAHHQEFIHCTLGTSMCHTGLKRAFLAGPGWNCSSILVLLESSLQTCMTYTSAECTVNKLLMMGRVTAQNMQSFMPK